MSIIIALQPNGERLRYEWWVYWMWIRGEINDPFLAKGLNNAVALHED